MYAFHVVLVNFPDKFQIKSQHLAACAEILKTFYMGIKCKCGHFPFPMWCKNLVVKRFDNAFHWINCYLMGGHFVRGNNNYSLLVNSSLKNIIQIILFSFCIIFSDFYAAFSGATSRPKYSNCPHMEENVYSHWKLLWSIKIQRVVDATLSSSVGQYMGTTSSLMGLWLPRSLCISFSHGSFLKVFSSSHLKLRFSNLQSA